MKTSVCQTIERLTFLLVAAKGKPVDSSQEMIALGLSNILGSFVGSMPVTASFRQDKSVCQQPF
jgi:sodium-independent sulfate anion transporter 11